MISNSSIPKRFWDQGVLLVTVYLAIELPLRIVLDYKLSGLMSLINIVIMAMFGIDIIMNFLTETMVEGKRCSNLSIISKKYLKTWFATDFISTIPFDILLSEEIISHDFEYLNLIRLFRLLRLINIGTFLTNLGRNEFNNPAIMRMAFLAFWVLLLSHWIACIWMDLGGGEPDPLNIRKNYIRALYWAITTLTTIGYGDIVPKDETQTIFTMVVQILGAGLYGYVIGNISSLLSKVDIAKANFIDKMEKVNTFMRYKGLPDQTQEHIRNYYNYIWENRRGFDEATVMDDLPTSLKKDIALYLNSGLFKKVPLFTGASDILISRLVLHLKPVIYTPGDYVFKKGDIGHNMYFISKGTVEVVSDDGNTVYASLHEGNFFGEIALLMNTTRTASIRASDYCDLYTLDQETLMEIVKDFPDFSKKVSDYAIQRSREMQDK